MHLELEFERSPWPECRTRERLARGQYNQGIFEAKLSFDPVTTSLTDAPFKYIPLPVDLGYDISTVPLVSIQTASYLQH